MFMRFRAICCDLDFWFRSMATNGNHGKDVVAKAAELSSSRITTSRTELASAKSGTCLDQTCSVRRVELRLHWMDQDGASMLEVWETGTLRQGVPRKRAVDGYWEERRSRVPRWRRNGSGEGTTELERKNARRIKPKLHSSMFAHEKPEPYLNDAVDKAFGMSSINRQVQQRRLGTR
jgi:hypothetical protein